MQVQHRLEGLDGVELVAVMPGTVDALARIRASIGYRQLLLSDPGWELHQALGLDRGTFRSVWLAAATWRGYARLIAAGRRPQWPREDVYRLGGVVVTNAQGAIVWSHRSRSVADYAPVEAVGEIAERVAGRTPGARG